MSTTAVLYAAKSTQDKRGSIPTQLADGRALAEREGLTVVAEYNDEAASAYKTSRGPGLAAARAHAERTGAVLVVQHTDRLARGDGVRADHLVELALWARKAGVRIASVQDPSTCEGGLAFAAMMGDRNNEDSARKGAATRDGLRRRKERGAPVGAMPLGYRAVTTVVDDAPITQRVVDPQEAAVVERVFAMLETGATYGQVTRALNADGVRTKRGGVWQVRTLRKVAENDVYLGRHGYSRLIEPERWERIERSRTRLDDVAVRARRGGYRPKTPRLLDGLAFCAACGASMYRREYADGVRLICAHTRQATGLCGAEAIPADVVEGRVIEHLGDFGLHVEEWLRQRAAEQDTERAKLDVAAARLRAEAAKLESRIARTRSERDAALDAGDEATAAFVLKELVRYDEEREARSRAATLAESRVQEWTVEPDLRAQVERYESLAEMVGEELKKAGGVAEMNAVLRRLLGGVYMVHDYAGIKVLFQLASDDPVFCDWLSTDEHGRVTTHEETFV